MWVQTLSGVSKLIQRPSKFSWQCRGVKRAIRCGYAPPSYVPSSPVKAPADAGCSMLQVGQGPAEWHRRLVGWERHAPWPHLPRRLLQCLLLLLLLGRGGNAAIRLLQHCQPLLDVSLLLLEEHLLALEFLLQLFDFLGGKKKGTRRQLKLFVTWVIP